MYHHKRRFVPTIAAGAIGFGALVAQAAQPATQPASQQDLQAQVDQLKSQVQQLESRQKENQADVTSAIQHVIADADKHSQMMAMSGGTAGYDPNKGIFIQDDSGNFLVHPWLQFDARYVANWRDKGKPGGQSDWQNGFEIRRMKIGFDGTLFTPNLTYLFQWNTTRTTDSFAGTSGNTTSIGGDLFLEDAWVKYKFSDAWAVRVGQFKDPLSHEQLTSSKRLLGVERSFLNDALINGDDYVQGITGIYDNGGPLRVEAGFTDGTQSQNTNYQNTPTNTSDWGVAGRAEYAIFGRDWKEYDQFTSLNDKTDLLVVGLGADYTGQYRGPQDLFTHTVDVQYDNPNGLSAYAAYVGRSQLLNHNVAGASKTYYAYGFLGQVGYLVTPQIEPFIRYDYTSFPSGTGSLTNVPSGFHSVVHEITIGGNYYFHGHAAKVTLDATYLPNGTPIGDSSGDILSNSHGEVVIRAQFQLLI